MTLLRGEDAEELEFGCNFGDLICVAFEAQARGLGKFLGWLAELVLGSQKLAPGTKLWDSAIDEAGNWFAVSILVMLATGVIALATGMLSMKKHNVFFALGGLAAAIPSTYLALGVGGELLKLSDDFSDLALKRLGGEDGFANVFRAVSTGGSGSDVAGFAKMVLSGGTANALPTMLMMILLIIGLIMMSFAIAFRNLGIMILIAFAPLAFMSVPMKGGWGITKKWGLAGIALLLSKPLMFGVLAMLLKSAKGMELFSPETLTVATGLFVVSFMPMMAYSFFSFLGSGNESQAGQNVGSAAGQKAGQSAKQAGSMVVSRGAGVAKSFGGGAAKAGATGASGASGAASKGGASGATSGGAQSGGQSGGAAPAGGGQNGQAGKTGGAGSGGQSAGKPPSGKTGQSGQQGQGRAGAGAGAGRSSQSPKVPESPKGQPQPRPKPDKPQSGPKW